MLGAIIGAVGGVASALIGSKSKPQKTTSEVDYVKMRANAEKAGLNFLTAVRNGGAAGFTTTTGTGGGPSFLSRVGQAVSGAADAFASFDPLKSQVDKAGLELLQAQIGHTLEQTAALRAAAAGVTARGNGALSRQDDVPNEIPGMYVSGRYYPPQPGESPAQITEDNHGGIWGEIDGARTGANRFLFGKSYASEEEWKREMLNTAPAMPVRRPRNLRARPTIWKLSPSW